MARRALGSALAALAMVLTLLFLEPLASVRSQTIIRQAPPEAAGRLVLPRARELWQVAPGTAAEQRVLGGTPLTTVTQASWSPDGRRIAYSLFRFWRPDRPAGSDLLTVSADGGEPTTVLPAVGEDVSFTEPVWSADGSSLIYAAVLRVAGSRLGETRNQVERVPAAGGERAVLVDDAFSPAVSRDGRQLAFLRAPTAAAEGDVKLWTADADGRNPRLVLDDPRFISLAFPRFSPTGDRLAFAAVGGPVGPASRQSTYLPPLAPGIAMAHGLPWDLWEIRLDGSGLRRLTDLAEDDPSLAWSPDGRWLAFQGGSGVYVIDVATTTLYQLSDAVGFGGMDWTS
jgi:Tol biopolymer transport system component